MNVGVALTHLVHARWVKNILMSTLAFDITQFFPLLNHCLLPLILEKVGFDSKISIFFHDYLVGRKTKYLWNSFSSPSFNIDVGVRQGSALSPFYLLYIFLQSFIFLKKS